VNSVFTIELFEEHQNVSFYTICFEEESSEFDKFLDKYPPGGAYDNDVNIIITWLDKIGESGALERYFRPEGRLKDDVCAIPIETSRLRLYVIRISDKIVVLGNGGRKKTKTYNEDSDLSLIVNQLQRIDRIIKHKMKSGLVQVKRKHLTGELKFDI